ncbi:hypothetical protein THAOC_15615 [Thalassiosira oceanica]|uniref:Fungal lipase-type domain-containing protein n=1 Tax=Thalassiosira oceanica TaxID=159749 RepID=K0SZX7_THAOC|nr:hypothetical protein THAOC_15615 [Thalassiosira oceanica]|eukprot:EJK63712.1 hypothetical protein THAOC_15615 [Thalassiosira oceanica]
MGAASEGELAFDLTIAARSIAVSTLAYHQPYTRGMNLDSYTKLAKTAFIPPLSRLVSFSELGRDVSNGDAAGDTEQSGCEPDAIQRTVPDPGEGITANFRGDWEYFKHESSSRQIKTVIIVTHGRQTTKSELQDVDFVPGAILVVFRGTDNFDNALSDIKMNTVPYNGHPFMPKGSESKTKVSEHVVMRKKVAVHSGFKDAWWGDGLRDTVLQYIFERLTVLARECEEANRIGLDMSSEVLHTKPTIDITGHSLGASIASLAAFDLAQTLRHMNLSAQSHLRVYTAGSPRTGNVSFARAYNELVPDTWHVINDNDIVPAMPHAPSLIWSILPAFLGCGEVGYRRHGRTVIIKGDGSLIVDPTRRQKHKREAKVLRLPKAIESHQTLSYRENIRSVIQRKRDEVAGRQVEFAISGMDDEYQRQAQHWKELDDNLQNLGDVIKEALSDPERSIRIFNGGN